MIRLLLVTLLAASCDVAFAQQALDGGRSPRVDAVIRARVEGNGKEEERTIARMSPQEQIDYFAKKKIDSSIERAQREKRFVGGLFIGSRRHKLTKEELAYNAKARRVPIAEREHLSSEELARYRKE